MITYRVDLIADDGAFLITCGVLPEVTSFAETREEAEKRALDAIEEALACRIANGEPLPPSDTLSGSQINIVLPVLTAIKVMLYQEMQAKNVTRAELARRLNWHREQVDRLFRLGHASRLDQLEAAFAALGLQLEAGVRAAA